MLLSESPHLICFYWRVTQWHETLHVTSNAENKEAEIKEEVQEEEVQPSGLRAKQSSDRPTHLYTGGAVMGNK